MTLGTPDVCAWVCLDALSIHAFLSWRTSHICTGVGRFNLDARIGNKCPDAGPMRRDDAFIARRAFDVGAWIVTDAPAFDAPLTRRALDVLAGIYLDTLAVDALHTKLGTRNADVPGPDLARAALVCLAHTEPGHADLTQGLA